MPCIEFVRWVPGGAQCTIAGLASHVHENIRNMPLRVKLIKRNAGPEPKERVAKEARQRYSEREMKKTVESWVQEFRNKRRSVNAASILFVVESLPEL